MQDLDKGHLLGSGSFGSLHKASWLGESYAMRIPGYQARACSSSMCYHPHIMHLVCCAKDEGSSVYVMERMDKSLSQTLTDWSKDSQPSLLDMWVSCLK
jgi:serine/threonine protein kinase